MYYIDALYIIIALKPCAYQLTLTMCAGVIHIGCYRLSTVKLEMFEQTTEELSDSPITRTEPIRKCGTASLDRGNKYFSLAEGMCFSGSNHLSDYTGDGESRSCSDGLGNDLGGQFVIDVYQIDDVIAFQESSVACSACGKDFCSQLDPQTNWRLMCSVSSDRRVSPSLATIFLLLLVSCMLITVSMVL